MAYTTKAFPMSFVSFHPSIGIGRWKVSFVDIRAKWKLRRKFECCGPRYITSTCSEIDMDAGGIGQVELPIFPPLFLASHSNSVQYFPSSGEVVSSCPFLAVACLGAGRLVY